MSSNNVAHVSSVDKGLKMKIKRTKGPSKVDPKHEVVKSGEAATSAGGQQQQQQHTNSSSSSSSSLSSSASSSSAPSTSNCGNTLLLASSSSSLSSSASSNTGTVPVQSSGLSNAASSSVPSSSSPAAALSVTTSDSGPPGADPGSSLSLSKVATSSDNHLSSDTHWVGPLTKSPLKSWNLGPSGSSSSTPSSFSADSPSAKDGKSPKFKAAYSKKTADGKSSKASLLGGGQNALSGGNASGANVTSSSSSLSNLGGDSKKMSAAGCAAGTGGGSGWLGSSAQAPTSTSSSSGNPSLFSANARVLNSGLSSEPRPGDTVHVKRENPVHDPYEFNAKVEDKIELPPKKLKIDKPDYIETAISPQPPHPHHHNQQQQQQQQQQHHHHLHQQHLSSMQHGPHQQASSQQQQHHQQQQQHQQQHQQHHHHHQQQQQHFYSHQFASPQKRSVAVETCSAGTVTEPECLGPCEPGSSVRLEGIVWKETDNGLLVVNVTWRGKTYMGTLMDSTRYAWAPPRPGGCESPVSDFESRTPKGRGKRTSRNSAAANERLPEGRRLRKGRRGTVNSGGGGSNFTAPPSPAKSEAGSGKRKVRADADSSSADRSGKRSRSCSRGGGAESPAPTASASADAYIVCPEPNCHKKYKHMNGLRYHRTHAHIKSSVTEDGKEDMECDDEEEEKVDKKDRTPLSERAERMKAKEKQRLKDQKRGSDRDSKDSVDDDIPLKDLANKVAKSVDANNGSKDKEETNKPLDASSIGALASNSKTDPHVVLTKTTMHLATDSSSLPGLNSTASKSKDTFDVPSSSLSTPLSSGATTASSSLSAPSSSSSLSSSNTTALASSVPFNPSAGVDSSSSQFGAGTSTVPVVNNSSASMPVMTTLKSPITSQVYQISPTGCLGGVTLVSTQTNPSLSLVSAQTFPLTTSTSPPGPLAISTTSTTTSVLGMSMSVSDRQPGKQGAAPGGGPGGVRLVSNARPIAPAPVPGLQNAPGGSSLKAIQPKPQTGGEYSSNVSASLADLSKDKTKKSKKKRSENKDSPSSSMKGSNGPDSTTRDEDRTNSNHVIKGSSNIPSSTALDTTTDSQSTSDSAFRQALNASPSPDVVGNNNVGGGLRPSFLPVTPGGSDMRNSVNDDVHSPAYSDISDANDTGSPPQRDSPGKKDGGGASLSSLKKEGQVNGSPHLGLEGGPPPNSLPSHFGGMYYFGGPPGYLPHGLSPQSLASPTLKKDGAGVEDGASNNQDDSSDRKDGARQQQQQQRSAQSPQQMAGGNSGSEMQQKNLINYYAHLHGVSPAAVQYQYNLAGHPPPTSLDHFQQALAAQQDPILRQHLIEQHQKQQQQHQQRLLQQQQDSMNSAAGGVDASGKRTPSGTLTSNTNTGLRHHGGGSSPFDKSAMVPGGSDHKRLAMADDREQALREKQSENHQILKENIELKSHMGQHPFLLDMHHQQQQLNYRLMKQQQEQQQQQQQQHQLHQGDLIRAQMFQQQKQKIIDGQRPDLRKGLPELTTSGMGHQQLPRMHGDLKPEDLVSNDMIKKEPRSDSVSRLEGAGGGDTKRFDVKEESLPDASKSSRPSSQSGASTSGGVPASSHSASTPSPSPLGAATPVSLVTSLPGPPPPGFPYSSYYPPPGAFRPMQLDPAHPMYRALNPHIIGYAGGPHPGGFIHPSQLGYRLPGDLDGKSPAMDGKVGGFAGVPLLDATLDGKPGGGGGGGAPGLGVRPATPLHKIHELQEKGRHPSPGVHSPAPPGKSAAGDGGGKGGAADRPPSVGTASTPGPQDKGSNSSSSSNNNNNNNNNGGGVGGSGKDKQREYTSSPPTQRHVHTHHHTHVVGGFPPLYPPDAYSGKPTQPLCPF